MNNRTRIIGGTLAALTVFGLSATLEATLAVESGGAQQRMSWQRPGGEMAGRGAEGGMMQVLHELHLSDAQKQQVHTLKSTARGQWQSQKGAALNDLPALGNPGDPNHAAAVQSAQARAAQRIQNASDLEQQIYGVLTPAQQAQLPQLLTQLQSRMAAHRHDHQGAVESPSTP